MSNYLVFTLLSVQIHENGKHRPYYCRLSECRCIDHKREKSAGKTGKALKAEEQSNQAKRVFMNSTSA